MFLFLIVSSSFLVTSRHKFLNFNIFLRKGCLMWVREMNGNVRWSRVIVFFALREVVPKLDPSHWGYFFLNTTMVSMVNLV